MSGKLLIMVRSCAQSSKAVSLELDPLPRFVRTFKACMPQARASTKGDAVSGLHRLSMEHFEVRVYLPLKKKGHSQTKQSYSQSVFIQYCTS